jgi:7,8-dihydropterin-6-yl-methyl-4-(beta-D-ribofuranosyl)aminobenzene 5'-phosphate synthase
MRIEYSLSDPDEGLIKDSSKRTNLNPDKMKFMMPGLSLTILVENATLTDRYFSGEPGLSFLIETEGKKILFDTGFSDLFLQNAGKMGISLLDLDMVVLSHGHLDHSGGLFPLIRHMTRSIIEGFPVKKPVLVAHPWCFYQRPKSLVPDTGTVLSEQELSRFFDVRTTTVPLALTKNLVFLGEIERNFEFERADPGTRKIIMPDGSAREDHILDDSALAFRLDEGLVIVTGCSHAGICNSVEQAKRVCGNNRIIDIIGGLHLLKPPQDRLEKTGEYLQDLHLLSLHACHCTSLSSKIALAGYCPLEEVGTGMILQW